MSQKKYLYVLLSLLLTFILTSCSSVTNVSNTITTSIKSKYLIKTVSNEFDPYIIRELTRNVVDQEDLFSDQFIELNARQFIRENKEQNYSLILVYRGDESLQVKGREPMILLIDGERIVPEKINPELTYTKQEEFRDRKQERETFKINVSVLKKLAHAKVVKIKINGEKRSIVCSLNDMNIEGFRELYEKYIKDINN